MLRRMRATREPTLISRCTCNRSRISESLLPEIHRFPGRTHHPPRSTVVEKSSAEERRKYIARIQREHRRIIEAIAAQDAKAAMAAMRAHLGESRTRHHERLKALRKQP